MILQTKASILTALLDLEGGHSAQVKVVLKDKTMSHEMENETEIEGEVSNDRTRLKAYNNQGL